MVIILEHRHLGAVFAVEGSIEIYNDVRQNFLLVEEISPGLFDLDGEKSFPHERIIRVILKKKKHHDPNIQKSLEYFDRLLLQNVCTGGFFAERWVRCAKCKTEGQDGYILAKKDFLPASKLCQPHNKHFSKVAPCESSFDASYKEFRNTNAPFKLALGFQLIGDVEASHYFKLECEIGKLLKLEKESYYKNENENIGDVVVAFRGYKIFNQDIGFCFRFFHGTKGLTCVTELQSCDDKELVEAADKLDQVTDL